MYNQGCSRSVRANLGRRSVLKACVKVLAMFVMLLPSTLSAQATYNVKNYGALGDGATDDTRAVQAAINAAHAASSGIVYFPATGACYMVRGLTFYANLTYSGENQGVCIKSISSSATLVSTPASAAFSNVTISNLTFNGNASSFTGYDCLELRGPTNVVIDHVTATRCGEDGVYVTGWGTGSNPAGQGNGLLITNLTSSSNGRNGMSIISGMNITVRNSVFEQHTISAPFSGVDIEPNSATQSVGNITFENCTFLGNAYNGFNVWEAHANRPNFNLRLINNTFQGNGRDGAYIAASGYVLGGIYVSGNMSANQSQGGYRGGLDIWNATNVIATNLSVTGASQALFLWGVNGAKVASSSLSGLSRDLNTNSSTNVQIYTSTQLAHQTHSGTYSTPSGTAPKITTTSPWAASVNTSYSETLVATGDPTITWTQVAGSLPPGLALSGAGTLTGTPTSAGTYIFTVQPSNNVTYDEKTLAMTVANSTSPSPTPAPLAISTSSLPGGTVSSAYSATLSATGGSPPYTWSASGLPAGLTLNSSTGQITGTPTTAGSFNVNAQVKDASAAIATRTFTVSVAVSVSVAPPPAGSSQPTFNVKNYGALGNGSTNDTTAVQATINAAQAAGSGTVYFPSSIGCYMVTSLTFYSNLSLHGPEPERLREKHCG